MSRKNVKSGKDETNKATVDNLDGNIGENLEKIDLLESKNADLLKTIQMTQAEFENYRKRVERDRALHSEMSNKDLILNLLPALDNFEIAFKSQKSSFEDFMKGMELIYSQMLDILKKEGLEPINAIGERFNPHFHECLLQEESDKDSGTVIEEFQKGYLLREKVIRPTKVKIAK